MPARTRGVRLGAAGVVGVLACVVLTGCGDNDSSDGKKSSGNARAGSPGAREEGTQDVRTAYRKTEEAESARMTMRVRTSAEGKSVTTQGQGAIDFQDGESSMTVRVADQTFEQRVVDQILYQKLPAGQKSQVPGNKPWIKIDLKKVAARGGLGADQGITDPADSAAFAKGVTDKDVKKVGTTTIDGVNTTQYRVMVDVAKLPDGAALRQQVGSTMPMNLWLDDEGRIRRQQVDMTFKAPANKGTSAADAAQQATVRMLIEYSDFGTDVEADEPPANQTADMTDKVLRQSKQAS
ncbi:lipoprotein [Streptomyces deserti]